MNNTERGLIHGLRLHNILDLRVAVIQRNGYVSCSKIFELKYFFVSLAKFFYCVMISMEARPWLSSLRLKLA